MKFLTLIFLMGIGTLQADDLLKLENGKAIEGRLTGDYKPATVELKTSRGELWIKLSELGIEDQKRYKDEFVQIRLRLAEDLEVANAKIESLKMELADSNDQIRRLENANQKLKSLTTLLQTALDKPSRDRNESKKESRLVKKFEGSGDKTFEPFVSQGSLVVKWTLNNKENTYFSIKIHRDGERFMVANANSKKSDETWVKAPIGTNTHWFDVTYIGDEKYTIEVYEWVD